MLYHLKILALLYSAWVAAQTTTYSWQNVVIGGGGYVTDIYTHPKEPDLVYSRTDVGGFYRWNHRNRSWIAITDWLPDSKSDWYGGEALAIDPSNPRRLYIACGKYAQNWSTVGTIFTSDDQGDTWTKSDLSIPMGSNEDKRWAGQRLQVDPYDPNHIVFGSRKDGIWASTNAGMHWTRNAGWRGTGKQGIGVLSICFDPSAKGLIYANSFGDGIYRSTNSGRTWERLVDSPSNTNRLASSMDGCLYATTENGVYRFSKNTWLSITPPNIGGSFCGLSINPRNQNDILVATGERDSSQFFRSLDKGATWREVSKVLSVTTPWYSNYMRRNPWVSAIEFDKAVPGRAWFTDWYATYQTQDIDAKDPLWTNPMVGHEEIVTFALSCPPQGAELLSGAADVEGFRHSEGLNSPPQRQLGGKDALQDTYCIDFVPKNPQAIVRASGNRWGANPGYILGSNDGGASWSRLPGWSSSDTPLRVAVSAFSSDYAVVIVSKGIARVTNDGGKTFQKVIGLPNGPEGPWYFAQPLAADRVVDGKFYYYSEGKLYRSTDRGRSFSIVCASLPSERWAILKTSPSSAGELWLSLDKKGLYTSSDGGSSFQRIPAVEESHLIAVGKSAPRSNIQTLFLYGKVNGQERGVFRSIDRGASWTRISAKRQAIGDRPEVMEASQQRFGVVFIGTNGRGIYVGEP